MHSKRLLRCVVVVIAVAACSEDRFVINKNTTNNKCSVQRDTERPQLGQRIAGPFASRREADERKAQLVTEDTCAPD